MASFDQIGASSLGKEASSSQPNSQPHDEPDENASYVAGLTNATLALAQRIHKVPERFRKGNEEFYRPRVVTIGPYHDFDAHLRCLDMKLDYGTAFSARYRLTVSDKKELGRRLGERASDYYLEQIPGNIGTMMLVDGVFLLELMLRSRFPGYRKAGDDDPIFNSPRIIVDICRDILLMENQLPWIVLKELYEQYVVPHHRPEHVSFPQLARHFFNAHLFDHNNIHPTPTDGDEFHFDRHSKLRNLLAFVRSFYSSRPKSSQPPSASDGDTSNQFDQHSIMRNFMDRVRSSPSAPDGDTSNDVEDTNITVQLIPPSVSKLYEAGVKFHKLFSASSGLSIEFDKGLLKIPHLDYWTGTFFLNVMVLEENEYLLVTSGRKYVSQFMFFMGWMIRTSKDVDILIDNGIISSMLGSNTDLVALFDRIRKMGWPHDYYDLCQQLNDYCTSSWHKWKATLKRDYFDTPWKIASTIAAVILLLLTLMQTVCSFLSLKP